MQLRRCRLQRAQVQFCEGWGVSVTFESILAKVEAMPVLFSEPQRRILGMLASGLTNKHIAREMGLSEQAVKSRRRTLRYRLGARNSFQAAVLAAKRGLV